MLSMKRSSRSASLRRSSIGSLKGWHWKPSIRESQFCRSSNCHSIIEHIFDSNSKYCVHLALQLCSDLTSRQIPGFVRHCTQECNHSSLLCSALQSPKLMQLSIFTISTQYCGNFPNKFSETEFSE